MNSREPLKEIAIQNDSQTDTPMSVSGVVSPMSVMSIDKSQIDLDGTLPRNDRERFFEVIEYQKNILQYFRENEVRKCVDYDKNMFFLMCALISNSQRRSLSSLKTLSIPYILYKLYYVSLPYAVSLPSLTFIFSSVYSKWLLLT